MGLYWEGKKRNDIGDILKTAFSRKGFKYMGGYNSSTRDIWIFSNNYYFFQVRKWTADSNIIEVFTSGLYNKGLTNFFGTKNDVPNFSKDLTEVRKTLAQNSHFEQCLHLPYYEGLELKQFDNGVFRFRHCIDLNNLFGNSLVIEIEDCITIFTTQLRPLRALDSLRDNGARYFAECINIFDYHDKDSEDKSLRNQIVYFVKGGHFN